MSEAILPRIAREEPTAVDECITRYGSLVWHLARRICPADAEDAVQEVFIDLWKNAAVFDPERSTEPTFISMIARRRLFDRRRKQLREPPHVELQAGDTIPAAFLVDRLESAEELTRIARYWSQLQPLENQVLRLALEHNQSHSQIAQSLGIPLGTVKSHARRGLIKLREWLQVVLPDGETA